MSNELVVKHSIGVNVYAIIFKKSNNYVWDAGDSALEAAGTWNDARVGECDVPLTDRGAGLYTADFPISTAGTYRILYFERAGGSPDTTDICIGRATIEWSGTSETTTPGAGSGQTLADLRSICYYHGWHNKTTDGVSALDRFINNTLQKLSVLAPWPEYHKRDGRITLAEDDEDYVITDDSDQTITNISRVGDVLRTDWFKPLAEISIEDWMEQAKTNAQSGMPRQYALRKYVSSGLIRIEMLVYPNPGSAAAGEYLYFPYWLFPDELALSTDETDWPNYRLWLLEEALERRVASGKRDSHAVSLETPEFYSLVEKAMADSRPSYMPIKVYDHTSMRRATLRDLPIEIV